MKSSITRRQFNRTAIAAAAGSLAAPAFLRGQNLNGKMNIAVIGSGGRGAADMDAVSKSENIVALCDVNERNLAAAGRKFPNAKKFTDFREMFDKSVDFDAVTIATCEHTHALATMLALK